MKRRITYAITGAVLLLGLVAGTLRGAPLGHTAGKPLDRMEPDGVRVAVTAGLEIISGNDRMAYTYFGPMTERAPVDGVEDAVLLAGIRTKNSATDIAY